MFLMRDKLKAVYESKTLRLFCMFTMIMMFAAMPAFASQPKIVSGAINLANAAFTWLLGIIPVTAILMFAWHAWMKSLADGESGAVAERNKKMKNVIIYSSIALGASALVTLLTSYLK